jgi:hypothetical protein
MNRSGPVFSRRARILAIGATVTSLAVSAWAWQRPGENGGGAPPLPGNAVSPAEPGGEALLPQPIYTNRPTFRIPFQFNPDEISRLGAREIRLYASGERGAQWHHVQTVGPDAGKFNFKTSGDGEYWFTVQTVDRNNQLHPGGPVMQPGLIVIVDSTRPTLRLALQQGQAGQVQLSWNSADEAVDPESLSMEYSQTGAEWQQVGVLPAATGQTSWSVPLGGIVSVRGRIRDRAGNEATAQNAIQVNPAAAGQTPGIPDLRGPVASTTPGLAFPPESLSVPERLGSSPLSIPTDPVRLTQVPSQNPYAIDAPPQAIMPSPNGSGFRSGTTPQTLSQPDRWQPAQRGGHDRQAAAPVPGVSGPFSMSQPGPGDEFNQTIQPGRSFDSTDSFVSSQPGDARQQFPTFNELPTFTEQKRDPGYRTVNSRKFHVDYQIDDIGPSGVSSVELYVTQNNGEKWFRYGIDEDRQSPFEVEVPGDGIYGFAMRVVSGAGLVDSPPQPNQQPEIVIVADSSPPVVNLLPLQQGTGRNSNRILITWEIQDSKLAERPVSLSYSANPNGPWEPVADWMPDSGRYIWTVRPDIAPRLYIRLIARDAAGNMAKVDTQQPVLVDLAKPTARIVDVESSVTNPVGSF